MSFGSNPSPGEPKKPSPARIAIWVVVSGVGLYMLATGVIGILAQNG